MSRVRRKELTPKQLEALNFLESGLSMVQVAENLGVQKIAIVDRVRCAFNSTEHWHPGTFIKKFPKSYEALKGVGAPYVQPPPPKVLETPPTRQNDEKIAEDLGISESSLRALRKRQRITKGKIANQPLFRSDEELNERVKEKINRVLHYMDDFALSSAKLSELGSIFKSLFEAKQLLDGKPTSIMDKTERLELDVLLPKLMMEAKRRGVKLKTVTGQVIEHEKIPIATSPVGPPPEPAPEPPPKKRTGRPRTKPRTYYGAKDRVKPDDLAEPDDLADGGE